MCHHLQSEVHKQNLHKLWHQRVSAHFLRNTARNPNLALIGTFFFGTVIVVESENAGFRKTLDFLNASAGIEVQHCWSNRACSYLKSLLSIRYARLIRPKHAVDIENKRCSRVSQRKNKKTAGRFLNRSQTVVGSKLINQVSSMGVAGVWLWKLVRDALKGLPAIKTIANEILR